MAELLGTFEQSVLLSIFGLGAEAYGRAILSRVQQTLERDIVAGAVYATLERLETRGLITSHTEAGTPVRGGRARRYYALSAEGQRALGDTRRALTAMWNNVELPMMEGR